MTVFRKINGLFFLLLLPVMFKAQSKVYTYIQEPALSSGDSNFSVKKVIDARINRENIGFIYSSDRRKKYPADFNHPLNEEFLSFYESSFPVKQSRWSLSMVVRDFSIDHQISELNKDQGYVKLSADFYLNQANGCKLLCNYSDSLHETSDDVRLSHPNRIKRMLLSAIQTAEASCKKLVNDTDFNSRETIAYEDLLQSGINKKVATQRRQIDPEQQPDYYFFNTGAYYSFSKEVMLFGITGSLVLQLKKSPQYLIGVNADLMIYGAPSNSVSSSNNGYNVKNYNLGIKVLKQIKNKFFLNLNPQLMLGSIEKYSQPTEKENLTGFELDFGAYLIPPREQGVYSGLNIFYRTSDSNLIRSGLGLKLDLGYRF